MAFFIFKRKHQKILNPQREGESQRGIKPWLFASSMEKTKKKKKTQQCDAAAAA